MGRSDPDRYRRDPGVDRIVQDPIELPAESRSDDDGFGTYVGAVVRDDDRTLYVRTGEATAGSARAAGSPARTPPSARSARRRASRRRSTGRCAWPTSGSGCPTATASRRSPSCCSRQGRGAEIDPAPVPEETIEEVGWFAEPPSPLDPVHAPVFEPYL